MSHVIAATLGWDIGELRRNRYQSTRTRQAIYSIGDQYMCIGTRKPVDEVGDEWREHQDQFFAKRAKTILWVCDMLKL